MYEQVQPRATKQITVRVDFDTVINQLLIRSDTFTVFDVLCRGKKTIPRVKWKQDRDGCFGIDIPEQTIKPEKPIQLSVRNLTDQPQLFDGWFSKKAIGSSIAVDGGWQVYEEPGIAIVNQRASNNANWHIQPMTAPVGGVFYWDYKYPAPIQDPYVEPINEIDKLAKTYGFNRLPDETDEQLRVRITNIMNRPNWVYKPYVPMQVSNIWKTNYYDPYVQQDYGSETIMWKEQSKYEFNRQFNIEETVKEDLNKATQSGQWHYEQKLKQDIKQCSGKSATKMTVDAVKKTISDAMTKAFKSFVIAPPKQTEYKKVPFGHCNSANDGCDVSSCLCHCSWCRDVKKYRSIA